MVRKTTIGDMPLLHVHNENIIGQYKNKAVNVLTSYSKGPLFNSKHRQWPCK